MDVIWPFFHVAKISKNDHLERYASCDLNINQNLIFESQLLVWHVKDVVVDASIDGRPVLFDRFSRFHRYLVNSNFFFSPVKLSTQELQFILICSLDSFSASRCTRAIRLNLKKWMSGWMDGYHLLRCYHFHWHEPGWRSLLQAIDDGEMSKIRMGLHIFSIELLTIIDVEVIIAG